MSLLVVYFLNLISVLALDIPDMTGPVVDQAQVLRPETEQLVSQMLRQANNTQKAQIQVLTLPSLQGESIEQVSIAIVDKWKLGTAKQDNGVLFLIAVQDRKMRIEVGQGLEGDLPDIYAKRIIEDDVKPYFRSGDYDSGVFVGVQRILNYVAPEVLPKSARPAQRHNRSLKSKLDLVLIISFMILFILSRMFGWHRRRFIGGSGHWGGGSSWGSSGGWGSGGGGGWSGGGGGFSGGGASGGW